MSPCTNPAAWTTTRAAPKPATSHSISAVARVRPSRSRSSSVPPSTSSMTRKGRPSNSPMSCTVTIRSSDSRRSVWASARNRARISGSWAWGSASTLIGDVDAERRVVARGTRRRRRRFRARRRRRIARSVRGEEVRSMRLSSRCVDAISMTSRQLGAVVGATRGGGAVVSWGRNVVRGRRREARRDRRRRQRSRRSPSAAPRVR